MIHNWIDIVILAFVLLFTILGVRSGLIKSLFRLSAWIGGAAGAWFGSDIVEKWLQANIASLPPYAAQFSASLIAFCIPLILLSLLGFLLHKLISASPLSPLNRLGGALLGFLKGAILGFLMLSLLHYLPAQGDLAETRKTSYCYDLYLSLSRFSF